MWSRNLVDPANYRALRRAALTYRSPVRAPLRYLTARGGDPWTAVVRTPLGDQSVRCDSWNDLVTVHEIFCRGDYALGPAPQHVLDVGANIGVAALWFLTRRPDAVVHSVEPVARHLDRLRALQTRFAGRHSIEPVAASDRTAEVEFAVEPSGRYGGIGLSHPERVRVAARDINEILAERLEAWPRIDVLKLDIEGHELTVLRHIDEALLGRVGAIAFEWESDPRDQLPSGLADRRYERRADVHWVVDRLP
jgi:FkbM family methyltransferase